MPELPEMTYGSLNSHLGDDAYAWLIYGKLSLTRAPQGNLVLGWGKETLAIISEREVYFSRNLPPGAAEYIDQLVQDNHLGEVFFTEGIMHLHRAGWMGPGEELEGKVIRIDD